MPRRLCLGGGRCSPRRPSPVPQPELPESPGAPRPGLSFWAVHKKARPHMAGLSFAFWHPVRCLFPRTTARKSMVGEFARMAGLGRQIGRLEIMIERCLKATVGGEWGTKTRTLGMSFDNDSVLHSGGSIQLWWSFPVHSNSQKRSPDPAPTGRRLFVPTPDSTGGNERGDAQGLRI